MSIRVVNVATCTDVSIYRRTTSRRATVRRMDPFVVKTFFQGLFFYREGTSRHWSMSIFPKELILWGLIRVYNSLGDFDLHHFCPRFSDEMWYRLTSSRFFKEPYSPRGYFQNRIINRWIWRIARYMSIDMISTVTTIFTVNLRNFVYPKERI